MKPGQDSSFPANGTPVAILKTWRIILMIISKTFKFLMVGLTLSGAFSLAAVRSAQGDEAKKTGDATVVPQQTAVKEAKTCPSDDDTDCNRWYFMMEKNQPDAWKYDHAEYSKKQRWYHVGQPVTPPKPKIIVLEDVHFDFDKYNLRPDAIPILESNLPELQHENIHVTIVGHADDRGSVEYNQKLSERRAQAVMDYYISRGIPAERLSAEGRSKLEPIAVNEPHQPGVSVKAENDGLHTGRALNRRIELHITNIASATVPTAVNVKHPATATAPEQQ